MKTEEEFGPIEIEVHNNNVIQAYKRLQRKMLKEGVAEDLRKREDRWLR